MRTQFLRTLRSPSVEAEQRAAYGTSRAPAAGLAQQWLGPDEAAFIAARDSFYLASIGNEGWPYVQHRGGPKGFVRVLDETRIAFGDYNGNRQLLTTGNARADDRVTLFLMDYPARERLKLIGHAEILTPAEAAARLPSLPMPRDAKLERVFVITVTGFDWNCPKFITPRYTAEEVAEATAPLHDRIAELEAALAARSPVPRPPPTP